MRPAAKREYMKKTWERYVKADRKAKTRILDEFCATYECDRKYAIRLMRRGPQKDRQTRRRGPTYSKRVVDVLYEVWQRMGHIWSNRAQAALPLWMPAVRRHYHLTAQEERQMLAMSPRTMDRRLKDRKHLLRKKIYGTTKPGTWIKHEIPIRRGPWNVRQPGFIEMDLVSHSGNNAEGDFAQTLNMTDILTGWAERRCLPTKARTYVRDAVVEIRKALPFKLRGLDVDSGSEFINHLLYDYCEAEPKVKLTRSRPGRKNDNAHIEQKNDANVRRWLGYFRYDTTRAVAAIDDLYRNELRLFTNLFQPSVRLKKKTRVGSRMRRVYDDPRTPLDRLIDCKKGDVGTVRELRELRDRLDPIALSRTIDGKLKRIWAMASNAPTKGRIQRRVIPAYTDLPAEGPPHIPDFVPVEQHYERIWQREQSLEMGS